MLLAPVTHELAVYNYLLKIESVLVKYHVYQREEK
jgi:hypothetical protein